MYVCVFSLGWSVGSLFDGLVAVVEWDCGLNVSLEINHGLDGNLKQAAHQEINAQKQYALNPHGGQLRARSVKCTSKNRARSSRADSPSPCLDRQQQLRAILLGFYSKSRPRSCAGTWRN